MAAQLDRAVAITAIISAAVVLVVAFAGLVVVAVKAGDVVGLSLAIGGTITAVAGLVMKLRGNGTGNPTGGQ